MHRQTNISLRLRHLLGLRPARWAAACAFVALIASISPLQRMDVPPAPAPVEVTYRPDQLSETDAALYRQIFASQHQGDFTTADTLMTGLDNQRLLGYVLAERYLDKRYTATADEIKTWLANYADHPQAGRMASLAMRRGADVDVDIAREALRGDGYTDHLGRSSMPDSWFRALSLWRDKRYGEAQPMFAKIAADENLSDWPRAAAYYWSYRAAQQLNRPRDAERALERAAAYPTTFYGLLALQAMGRDMPHAEAPTVSASLRRDPHTIRAMLLSTLGRTEEAEQELRRLYSSVGSSDRPGIVTLASEMGLANLQLRLAKMPELSASEALFASYPVPSLVVHAQDAVDPALLLAVVRNESSFQSRAASGKGAQGMMQMLPSTARAVERHIGADVASMSDANTVAERLNDPATSVRLGAHYLKLLQNEPAIGNNTVRILAGYNAGPGAVASWGSSAQKMQDPLLYIEMIPYAETRNYVMQVMAQYWVYQQMLGQKPASLAALETGSWPQA